MKNITYLFGAGASVNAVPVQKKLEETVREFSRMISGMADDENWNYTDLPPKRIVKRELVTELDWLAEQIKSNGTPDVLAENLNRQKKFSEIRRLKIIYSTFLVFVQCSRITEQRYIRFLNRIMDNNSNQLKSNVRVLSWNYDFQLERGFSDVSYSSLSKLQQNYGFYQIDNYDSVENSRASIFNLNGTASFYDSQNRENNNKYEFDFHSNALTKSLFDSALRIFGIIFRGANFRPHLSFSWENNIVVSKAIEKVKDTDILVVVGYSFPDENRTVDKAILSAMNNLNEIHIQDPDAYNLKRKLLDLYLPYHGDFGGSDMITERTEEGGFYIPNDLFHSIYIE